MICLFYAVLQSKSLNNLKFSRTEPVSPINKNAEQCLLSVERYFIFKPEWVNNIQNFFLQKLYVTEFSKINENI